MKIKYLVLNNQCYIQAYNEEETWLSTVILNINCDEYPRYKEYCNGNKLAKIIRVETNPNYVGQGIASTLIRNAIKKYKDYNFVLLCSPQRRCEDTDTLTTVEDLQMFYSKFGFIKTNELLPTMVRIKH